MQLATGRGVFRRNMTTAALLAFVAGWSADAGAGEVWMFDFTTTGQDVSWMSPTSVDPAAAEYSMGYDLTLIEVDVQWGIFTIDDIDVTDQVPVADRSGQAQVLGPAPVTFVANSVVFPDPPAAPSVAADLTIGIDAGGFGTASATNVTLGTAVVDLGPFGVQTVDILSVRVVGTVTAHATWFDRGNALAGVSGLPSLVGTGSLVAGDSVTLTLSNANPSTLAALFVGFSGLNAPFNGGILVPSIDALLLGLPTNAAGQLVLTDVWPAGVPADTSVYFQFWISDAAGVAGFSATNGLEGVAQ